MTTHDDTQRWPLPDGWRWMKLGELGSWCGGGTPSKGKPKYWIEGQLPWVSPKDMKQDLLDTAEDKITHEALKESSTSLVKAHSILLVTRSGILSHTLPIAINTVDVTINQDIKALTLKPAFDTRYIFHCLKSFGPLILEECTKQGTTVASVNFPQLKSFAIPVPPLDTQRQLVTTIERLFARVARAREALSAAPDLLEQLRQSVLAAAFRGDLTRAWREANPDAEPADALLDRIRDARRARFIDDYAAKKLDKLRAKSPISPADEPTLLAAARREAEKKYTPPAPLSPDDLTDLPELPQGWCWAKLDEVFAEVKNGVSIKPEGDTGERILRISAVRPLKIDYEDTRYLSNVEGLEDYKISYGDLLYTRYNGSIELVGVCSLVREDVKNIFYPDKLIRCRCAIPHIAPWVELATSSMYIRAIIERMAKSTSGQTGISGADLKSLAIPLPSADELPHIVAQVSLAWSKLSISAQVADMTAQLDQLEQSILSKAFRGELGEIEAAVERVEAVASAATQGSLFDL